MGLTRRRKKRTHRAEEADPAKKGEPKSFVFRRGRHGLVMKDLEADLRRVMQPNTATHLKESKRNQLKDFVHIAGPLGVTHFLILTATSNASYLRVAKSPRGPTLTMRVHEYALIRDVVASQARPRAPQSMWQSPPLVVMNNFGGQEHLKLAVVLFQNLFPAINVQTVKLSSCQRVVLLSYDKGTRRISFRHYNIWAQPSGVNKGVKALLARSQLPDLHDFKDVSDFLTRAGYGSESEGEEAGESRVTLAQDLGRGNVASRQSRVKLQEVGPRMELEVVKVEEGLCDGRVLFHSHVEKSAAEVKGLEKRKDEAERLRKQRRAQQEDNVRKKQAAQKRKEEEEAAAGQGKPKRRRMWWEEELAAQKRQREDDVDDNEYFRQEVGEEPDEDFAHSAKHRSRSEGGRGRDRGGRSRGEGDGGGGRGGRHGRGMGSRGMKPSRHSDSGGGRGRGDRGGRGGGNDRRGGRRGGGRRGGSGRGRGRGRQ